LRNNHDCKAVDPYNARKKYAVIEIKDHMRNIPWWRVVSLKLRNPIK
jgi:hypothetical protein